MANKKHYIITSITLGIIAASSALLIGLTHVLTKDQIAKNEENKVNAGIQKIYGEDNFSPFSSSNSRKKVDKFFYGVNL